MRGLEVDELLVELIVEPLPLDDDGLMPLLGDPDGLV